jgi:hypothetical protein
VRVEFWDDTVEDIRWFKVADQRSLEIAEHGLWAPPCRELLLTDANRERARRAGELPRCASGRWKSVSGALASGAPVGQLRAVLMRSTSRLAVKEVPKTKRIRGPNVMAAALPTKYSPGVLDWNEASSAGASLAVRIAALKPESSMVSLDKSAR